eukprot:SAG11_NODE_381_length_9941_cov_11.761885_11_plen_32_part_00
MPFKIKKFYYYYRVYLELAWITAVLVQTSSI